MERIDFFLVGARRGPEKVFTKLWYIRVFYFLLSYGQGILTGWVSPGVCRDEFGTGGD